MQTQQKKWKITHLDYESIRQIPESIIGIYVMWCPVTKVCIYVGKAEGQPLKNRLKDHYDRKTNKKLNLWLKVMKNDNVKVCYRKTDVEQINCLEKRLIQLWKPTTNDIHNPNRRKTRRK